MGDVKDGENMLAKITDGGTFTNWGTNIGGKLGIDITPVNGLKISAAVAPNFNNVKKKTFVKQIPYTRSRFEYHCWLHGRLSHYQFDGKS